MSQTYVKRLRGIAGGGKSYQIRRAVEEALADGMEPSDIVVITYTTSQKDDLRDEFREEFDYDEFDGGDHTDDGITVTTFHSLALSLVREAGLVDLQLTRIIQMSNHSDTGVFQHFFRDGFDGGHFRYEFVDVNSDEDDEYRTSLPTGNAILQAYNYCRAQGWAYTQYDEAPVDVPARRSQVLQAMREWDEYKENYLSYNPNPYNGTERLLQHDDYLYETLENSLSLDDYEMLVVDEAQDMNKIQYAVYEMWRNESGLDRVMLCGDDAQGIFGFRGGDSRYFLNTPVDDESVLTATRRCKPKVLNEAKRILAPMDEYDTDSWRAIKPDGSEYGDDEQGTVKHHTLTKPREMPVAVKNIVERYLDGSQRLFILGRTNADLDKVENLLLEAGIPHVGMGSRSSYWDRGLFPVLGGLDNFDRWNAVPSLIVNHLMKHARKTSDNKYLVEEAKKDNLWTYIDNGYVPAETDENGFVTPEQVSEWFGGAESATDILRRLDLSDKKKQVLLRALKSSFDLDTSDWVMTLDDDEKDEYESAIPVVLGTHHAAKGKQAEAAIVLSGYSKRQKERYDNGQEDEERRLYYTACTRPKSALFIIHGFCGDEEFPPLSHSVVAQ